MKSLYLCLSLLPIMYLVYSYVYAVYIEWMHSWWYLLLLVCLFLFIIKHYYSSLCVGHCVFNNGFYLLKLTNIKTKQKLIYCYLLIILSIYAYINRKPMIMSTWIQAPWTLYYDLYFTLYQLNTPLEPMGKTVEKTYHHRETCQFFYVFLFERNILKYAFYTIILDNPVYQAMNNIEKKTSSPSIHIRFEDFIENMNLNPSCPTMPWVFIILLFPFFIDIISYFIASFFSTNIKIIILLAFLECLIY